MIRQADIDDVIFEVDFQQPASAFAAAFFCAGLPTAARRGCAMRMSPAFCRRSSFRLSDAPDAAFHARVPSPRIADLIRRPPIRDDIRLGKYLTRFRRQMPRQITTAGAALYAAMRVASQNASVSIWYAVHDTDRVLHAHTGVELACQVCLIPSEIRDCRPFPDLHSQAFHCLILSQRASSSTEKAFRDMRCQLEIRHTPAPSCAAQPIAVFADAACCVYFHFLRTIAAADSHDAAYMTSAFQQSRPRRLRSASASFMSFSPTPTTRRWRRRARARAHAISTPEIFRFFTVAAAFCFIFMAIRYADFDVFFAAAAFSRPSSVAASPVSEKRCPSAVFDTFVSPLRRRCHRQRFLQPYARETPPAFIFFSPVLRRYAFDARHQCRYSARAVLPPISEQAARRQSRHAFGRVYCRHAIFRRISSAFLHFHFAVSPRRHSRDSCFTPRFSSSAIRRCACFAFPLPSRCLLAFSLRLRCSMKSYRICRFVYAQRPSTENTRSSARASRRLPRDVVHASLIDVRPKIFDDSAAAAFTPRASLPV